jgi:hypothetical protein
MPDLVPHPLVTDVGLSLGERDGGALATYAEALREAAKGRGRSQTDDDTKNPAEKNELAAALANQANLPDLTLFAGFLGGPVPHDGATWRLFYLDARLDNWLLVPQDDIVVHQRLNDDRAPSGRRDALWIRGTATLVRGSGSRAGEGRFLVGEFTRAGDFAASTTGGTFSAASGLLCEATTPGCCWGARSR